MTTITNLTDKMPFGKYQDKTIQEIINIDLNYAEWLMNNHNLINLSTDVRHAIRQRKWLAA